MVKHKKHSRKKLILLVGLALLVAGGGAWFYRSRQLNPVDDWQDGVNYRPPTEQEKAAGDDKKKEIVAEDEQQNQQNQNSQQTSSKKSVSVAITDASQYGGVVEVRSFVPSYSQDGTCTLTFTQGSRTFTRKTPGYKDVSSTVCPAVEVPTSDFPNSGDWQVVVSFESSDAKGQSEPQTFTVEK
jgi:hypothetical protein